ncbi:putative ankyrin repeat protein RF_0381 [Mytilus trossulus]|uniref:putative ankyrin repeat protein RF_0381 n=1 Tax=Mytilus trossulus TaxID=6551 RepID=UPI003007A349
MQARPPLIAVILVEHDMKTVAVGESLLVGCVVLGTVYVVYIFSTHQLVKPPKVYDEQYELQIYKLLNAASKGDMLHIKRIYNQKYIDINDTDYDTRSAFHLAASGGHHKAVEYLLKNNASFLERKDRCQGHTPAEDAVWHMKHNDNNVARKSFETLLQLIQTHKGLKKYKCSFKDDVAIKMIKAAEYGEFAVIERLHDSGTDMNLSDPDGRTALHAAVERNQEKVIYFLIDECKVSPFIRWRYEAADYDMTVSDYDKRTALHIAVNNNQEHVVEFLLKDCRLAKEANTVKDRWGKTPFETAINKGNENIVKRFCYYNPVLTSTVLVEKQVFTLCIAGEDDKVEAFHRLFESGDQINIQNSSGSTVWNLTADKLNTDTIQYLKDKSKANEKEHKSVVVTCKKEIPFRQTVN